MSIFNMMVDILDLNKVLWGSGEEGDPFLQYVKYSLSWRCSSVMHTVCSVTKIYVPCSVCPERYATITQGEKVKNCIDIV